ncbi:MAG: hypothetical protein WA690_15460 [Candidatus Acidiferrales bacterium]
MKKFSLYAITIALTCGATVLLAAGKVHRSSIAGAQPEPRMDAAFRDGLFLGRRDVEAGRTQHLITGRWSGVADRRLFVSGYLQAYREKYGPAGVDEFGSSLPVERAGYRDGLDDGFKDRLEARPFRAGATDSYTKAECICPADGGDLNEFKRSYRGAYSDGYQQAYYAQTE